MCELLGIAFNEPVTASISFRGFRHRGNKNPDGWGLAWFKNRQAEIRKEPAPAHESSLAAALQMDRQISSHIFVGHVRFANRGRRCLENTHPFCQSIHGLPVVFAHNGTLNALPRPSCFTPKGETDSEQAFCVLFSRMEENEIPFTDYPWIEDQLRELNRYGTMNLLFSNGDSLFAYRDTNGYNGLCLTSRKAPFLQVQLKDEDWVVHLSEEKKPSEQGCVIATRPLTSEHWIDLTKGRLLVIHGGQVLYGDPR